MLFVLSWIRSNCRLNDLCLCRNLVVNFHHVGVVKYDSSIKCNYRIVCCKQWIASRRALGEMGHVMCTHHTEVNRYITMYSHFNFFDKHPLIHYQMTEVHNKLLNSSNVCRLSASDALECLINLGILHHEMSQVRI